jgi:hypothetical protein
MDKLKGLKIAHVSIDSEFGRETLPQRVHLSRATCDSQGALGMTDLRRDRMRAVTESAVIWHPAPGDHF